MGEGDVAYVHMMNFLQEAVWKFDHGYKLGWQSVEQKISASCTEYRQR